MSRVSSSWVSPWSLAVAVCVLSVVFLWPTWRSLHESWIVSTRYSHGHLIVLICGYLLYRQREVLSGMNAKPAFLALVPFAVLLTIWLIAVLASIQAIQMAVLPLILGTMLLVVLGWSAAKRLWMFVAYLYLAIPVWESGNFVLQKMTVWAVELALWVFRVPAFIHGNTVALPAGAFEVEGGCSGLHYFIVAIALSVLYGLLFIQSAKKRFLLVALAVAAALLTNWLRVFIVVYVGYLTDMQHYLVTQDHYYFGWFLFAGILVPYLMIARKVEQSENNDRMDDPPTVVSNGVASAKRPVVALSACLVGLLVSGGAILASLPEDAEGSVELDLPSAPGAWTVDHAVDSDWRPHYVGTTAETVGQYRRDQGTVDAYFNLYRGQARGRELVGSENRVEGLDKWSISRDTVRKIDSGNGAEFWTVREVNLVAASGEQRMLYLWFDVGGILTASDLEAQLLYGINVLRGRRDAGVSILSATCGQGCEDARVLLGDWLRDHKSVIGDV